MKKQFHFMMIAVFLSIPAFSQLVSEQYVDSIVNESMTRMPHAGMAVAVIENGEVSIAKGYGTLSTSDGGVVDANSLFCIASNSKAFTSTALGILVDEGKLKWTDKVIDIIPEFTMYDEFVRKEFTILDLLTHRSGMGLGAGDLMLIPDDNTFTIDDVLQSFQHQKAESSFRTKYDYNNMMYLVAGEVVKRKSGMPWDEFVKQRIMDPLGMERSVTLFKDLEARDNVAAGHRVDDGKAVAIGPYSTKGLAWSSAGGIYSSVNDMAKWVQMHMNRGTFGPDNQDTIISKKNQNELWIPRILTYYNPIKHPGFMHYKGYGLGFNIFSQDGKTVVQHSGGLPGMLSMVTMIPEDNAAIIVLTNCAPGGYSFVSVTNMVKNKLLRSHEMDWVGRIETYLKANKANSDSIVKAAWATCDNYKEKVDAKCYEGTYKDDWFGEITITNTRKGLVFRSLRSPRLTGIMYPYEKNVFAIKWGYQDMDCDAFATFQVDDKGKALSISMKGIAPDIDFSFDFQNLDLQKLED